MSPNRQAKHLKVVFHAADVAIMTSTANEVDGFTHATLSALRYLKEQSGLGAWMVLRRQHDDAVVLEVDDSAFGFTSQQTSAWNDSICGRMVAGHGPNVAPDVSQVEAYRESPDAISTGVAAYIGVPILLSSGELFGALCGIDRERQSDDLHRALPLAQVFAEMLGNMIDVELQLDSEHRRLEQALALSTIDPVTGLANSLGWEEQLAREEERCRRHGTSAAVIMVELDGLDRRTELHGQAATELYVQSAASTISAAVGSNQLVAHVGSDRFGLALFGLTANEVAQIERRIHKALLDRSVSACLGAALRKPSSGLQGAVAEADAELFQNKRARGAGDVAGDANVTLLRDAIEQGAIRAYFQPIVDLQTSNVVSLEALARWVTDEGVREPAAFVPLVQRANLLRQLFERMLDDSLEQLQNLRHFSPELTVAVNLEFGPEPEPGLYHFVMSELRAHSLPPDALTLELSERHTVDVQPDVRLELERLAAAGVRLVLDDFGTGFASMDTLRALPISGVKIDRRFISQVVNGDREPEVVKAMIALAADAGVEIKAAGIETKAQNERLIELGVSQGQGYHFFVPQPPDSLGNLLSSSLGNWSARVA